MSINSEIYTDYKANIDYFEENGPVYPEHVYLEDTGLSDLDYEYYVSDDFISLVVIRKPQGWSGFMEEYRTARRIYNISMEDGHRLSKSEMLGLLGYTEEEFDEIIRDTLSAEWEDMMTEITGGYGSYADEMLDRNLSDEVIGEADVFVDPDGNICFKVKIETGAGSGFLQYVRAFG